MTQSVLRTKRLILRPLLPSDDSRIYALANHRKISDMTAQIPYPYPRELATEWIKSLSSVWNQGEGMVYGITLENGSVLAGVISLQNINAGVPALGYWLGVDFWGRGYATEAGRTLCDYAIKQLGINSVFACHLERNPASGRVLNKIGFKFIGQESKFISNHNKKEIVFNYLLGVEFLVRDCFIQE